MPFCTLKGACIGCFISGAILLAIGIVAIPVVDNLVNQQVGVFLLFYCF